MSDEMAVYEWTPTGPVPLRRLLVNRSWYRERGGTVVTTNGCFDLLHRGHLSFLAEAKALGQILIVGINSDESVSRLKGPKRPIQTVDERAAMLHALRAVDHVVVFADDLPNRWLDLVEPDIHCKAADYEGQDLPEAKIVRRYGEVRILPLADGYSTTDLIDRIIAGNED